MFGAGTAQAGLLRRRMLTDGWAFESNARLTSHPTARAGHTVREAGHVLLLALQMTDSGPFGT